MRFSSTALAVVCAASSGLERVDAQCLIGGSPPPAPLVSGTSLTCPGSLECRGQTITGCTTVTCTGNFSCQSTIILGATTVSCMGFLTCFLTVIQNAETVLCKTTGLADSPNCARLTVTNAVAESTIVDCDGPNACTDDQSGSYGTSTARLARVNCNGDQACGTITIFAREVFCENPGPNFEACFGTSGPSPNPIDITADSVTCGAPSPPPENLPACSAGCNFFAPGAPSAVPCTVATPAGSAPTGFPSHDPSQMPSRDPSQGAPSRDPSQTPSINPTLSRAPSDTPTEAPSQDPSSLPSRSGTPSRVPSDTPTGAPSDDPSTLPSATPSQAPSVIPTAPPSSSPSATPSQAPSIIPTAPPSSSPSQVPSEQPTQAPSSSPSTSRQPSQNPTTFDLCSPRFSADTCQSGLIAMYHTSVLGTLCTDVCFSENNVNFWKHFGYACGSCAGREPEKEGDNAS